MTDPFDPGSAFDKYIFLNGRMRRGLTGLLCDVESRRDVNRFRRLLRKDAKPRSGKAPFQAR